MWFKHTIIEKFAAAEADTSNAIRCYEENLKSYIAEVVSSEISAEKRLEKLICKLQQSSELAVLKGKIKTSLKSCKLQICSVNSSVVKFFAINVDQEKPALPKLLGLKAETTDKSVHPSAPQSSEKPAERNESMSYLFCFDVSDENIYHIIEFF